MPDCRVIGDFTDEFLDGYFICVDCKKTCRASHDSTFEFVRDRFIRNKWPICCRKRMILTSVAGPDEEISSATMATVTELEQSAFRAFRRADYYLRFALLGWSVAALIAIVNYFRP